MEIRGFGGSFQGAHGDLKSNGNIGMISIPFGPDIASSPFGGAS